MDSLKIGNGLPRVGPGTDIGISSLPTLGYLGKNYGSAKVTTDGYCPACRAKGKLNALKTYQINFQESVFLCEDLQCIYPLGSQSLTNLISPDLEDCHTQNKPQKRKRLETTCKNSLLPVHSKKARSHVVTGGEQSLSGKYNGKVCGDTTSDSPENTGHQNPARTVASSEQIETLEAANMDVVPTKDPATVSASGMLLQSEDFELEMSTESRCLSLCQTLCVQWKNSQALCWLDCILSALVHLEALRNTVAEVCSREECVFGRLFGKYDQADKLGYTHHLHGVTGEDCKKLTSEILAEIESCLNEVRDEIFIKLQPKLRCTLGEMESPVFALPALLKLEPHVEKLFTYSFSWNFECSHCGYQYQNRASPIIMLHFVEGLPRKDLQHYAFHFEGSLYQVTSVIQYQANNHFITWILDADGSWLECDDLKGPWAKRHGTCEVPASEIHIVVWERKLQVPTEEATCFPCTKPCAQPASGEEQPASPALDSVGGPATSEPSAAHPAHMPATPQTLPEVQGVAHGDSVLSGTEGSVETTSASQMDSKDCQLEGRPVAESAELVRALAVRPQDSLTTSLSSNPCEGKLVVPSGVSTHPQAVLSQAGDTAVPKPVPDAPLPVPPVQEVKSMVAEDTQIQLLPLTTERLKPAQPAKSQTNLRKRETIASSKMVTTSSPQNQPRKDDQKKAFVGSWVKGLLSRGGAFMPPCVLAQNRAVTDLQPSVKGASHFDGFKTKNTNRKANRMSRKASQRVDKLSPGSSSPPSGSTAALPHAGGKASAALLKGQESSHAALLGHSSHDNKSASSPAVPGDAAEDGVHKLRLKLLKKLKAKKKKLAALMSSPNRGTSVSDQSDSVSHCGSPNDSESIEDLLSELQHQIDLADNKSGCSPAPGGTSYNSQNHEEILAELLSPAALSEPSASVEPELRYLEMGDSTPAPSEFSVVLQNTSLSQDHNYCSPKKNQSEVEQCSLTDSTSIRTLNLGSPMKTDIFDEFFPASTLNSLTNDTLDIPHFDEYLFENC
ncbi:SUMO-specific isopeptidase USPL1 isoform X2 [Chionomys nivalis]|uniref:SUMO-specific isopeptidase USPL1 isoform X2 n=1 Tax=Chionomys nivalis TaxID=269649 RepID=UPI0025953709|nr:SUMO-specific isopeptidase USPL1 isoform X2 [Chionomys nivalis]